MSNPGAALLRLVLCCLLALSAGCVSTGTLRGNGLARYAENGDASYRIDVTSGHGSGVVVSAEGHILTCHHVIEDETEVTISIMEGGTAPRVYAARVLATDEANDLALLQIDRRFRSPAVIGDDADAGAGVRVYNIGYPFSFGEMTGRGYIMRTGYSSSEGSVPLRSVILADIPDGPGTSGSAVYAESSGRVIGIMRMMIAVGRRGAPPMVVRVLTPPDRIRAFLTANRVPYLRADGSLAAYPPLPAPTPPAPTPAVAPRAASPPPAH
jgi:S1-C subfamily serine protease